MCRLVCDQESSWPVKLQALDALNTLVSIGNSEEERLDFRAEVKVELRRANVLYELTLPNRMIIFARTLCLNHHFCRWAVPSLT